jgi:hypothetical protein
LERCPPSIPGLNRPQLSLFFGDLFQSLGTIVDVQWIINGIVQVGPLCTAQGTISYFPVLGCISCRVGFLQNTGQAAIAMSTFVCLLHRLKSCNLTELAQIITLHTFDSLWRHGGVKSLKWARILVGAVWTFLLLTIGISTGVHIDPPFYAPTPVRLLQILIRCKL